MRMCDWSSDVCSSDLLLPADDPEATPLLVAPRKKGREYSVDERDGTLYILTNDDHPNFRVATASLAAPGEWTTLIAGSDHSYLTGPSVFRDYLLLDSREDGPDQEIGRGSCRERVCNEV